MESVSFAKSALGPQTHGRLNLDVRIFPDGRTPIPAGSDPDCILCHWQRMPGNGLHPAGTNDFCRCSLPDEGSGLLDGGRLHLPDGWFLRGLLTGAFSDAFGQRTALTVVIPVATLIGGLMIIYGSRYMKRDISLTVSELIEMQEEQKRMAADPENIPMLQVRNVDASYGTLQVLFDVSFEVKRGECLALLGTNGAGKSTVLRSISGLLNPDRGVIRMNGRTITLVDPQYRVALGMMQIPGGEAVFPSMTVSENLELWSELIEDKEKRSGRIEETFAVFPELLHLVDSRAGSLSGGQQQMLALGKAIMLEPELLLIDELSLGLAPIVVQRLLGIVEKLKEQGTTMVLVEQSVNVALAVADRAVFMERGQVKFEGPAQELLERDDLLRAVFLSGEGA